MKKTIVILVLSALLLGVLWGCGSPIAEELPQTPAVEAVVTPPPAPEKIPQQPQAEVLVEQPQETSIEVSMEEPTEIPVEGPAEDPAEVPQEEKTPTCTISIRCDTILGNLEQCDSEKAAFVPADGWVLQPLTVDLFPEESVFDVLKRVCLQEEIHLEFSHTPAYGSAYIEGIANLYEFDVGPLSGWMYKVNDWFPNYGCSQHLLQDGDVVVWIYTCDLGRDVGGGQVVQNGE